MAVGELEDSPRIREPRRTTREQKMELLVVVAARIWKRGPGPLTLSVVRDIAVADPFRSNPIPILPNSTRVTAEDPIWVCTLYS